MTTTDDLRTELGRRAAALDGGGEVTRLAAVRTRVRTVRRRRGVAAVVAAVVLVAGGAVGLQALGPRDPVAPAGQVAGIDVPGSVTVLGFGYRLAETHAVEGDDTIEVDGERDLAVVLVGDGLGDGSATLYDGDEAVARVRGTEQLADPVQLGGGASLSVRLDGAADGARAGFAVYGATDELPDGPSNGAAVFREQLAGEPLVAAGFAEPGAGELTLTAYGSAGELRYVPWCRGPEDVWVNIDIDGVATSAGPCGGGQRDAGASSSVIPEGPTGAAADHAVRVHLTRGDDGPEVAPDDVAFGAGVYRDVAAATPALGARVEQRVEHDGRTWVLEDVREVPARIQTETGDRLVQLVGRGGQVTATWQGRLTSGSAGTASKTTSTVTLGVLLAGDSYDVTTDGGEARLLVYRPE